ncbi:MAG: hypothetical protein ACE1ZK_03065 [Nitrospirales bacterium]
MRLPSARRKQAGSATSVGQRPPSAQRWPAEQTVASQVGAIVPSILELLLPTSRLDE